MNAMALIALKRTSDEMVGRISRMLGRLSRIESILRANGLHEPSCEYLASVIAQRSTGAYIHPQPCTCWLRETTSEKDNS